MNEDEMMFEEGQVDGGVAEVEYTPVKDHLLSNTLYDRLRLLVELILPAIATLYVSLAQIWSWPNETEVLATSAAASVFLGVLIKLGDKSYSNSEEKYAGSFKLVDTGDEDSFYRINLSVPMHKIESKSDIIFKVE